MNVTIKFAIPNPAYDQSFADAHHDGKESPDNARYTWGIGYEMEEVLKIEEEVSAEFTMTGKFVASENPFEFIIPEMRVYRFIHGNGDVSTFAISEELIGDDRTIKPQQKNLTRHYFIDLLSHLNPHFDFAMPAEGILLAKKSIPTELLKQ
ncbi:MAG TPA: hypothetical protein VI731_09675 [Bacteroidia bacterium]|nr:hypothetical protein [Bacteroidia bacterium]